MTNHVVESLHTGAVRPLGPNGVPSGIRESTRASAIRLHRHGFAGDEQGDRRHHGGPDKAVHHYPREHYAPWRADLGDHPLLMQAGAFGENVSVDGLTEDGVSIGDRFRLGGAIVEVSQGRQPCFRLNLHFGARDMARRMQDSGRTGWYYRVIEEGLVAAGDSLSLIERPSPEWTIARLWRILYVRTLDQAELEALLAFPCAPERWRDIARKRIATRAVEDWQGRLQGG